MDDHSLVEPPNLSTSPGLITLHYPPADSRNDPQPLKTTMNTANICIHNILTKMSISGTEEESKLAWIERFFLKTSLTWREKNKSQPYRAAFPTEIVMSTSGSINLRRVLTDYRNDKATSRSIILAQNIRIHNTLTKMDLSDT